MVIVRFIAFRIRIALVLILTGTACGQVLSQIDSKTEADSGLRAAVEGFSADHESLDRFYSVPSSPARSERLRSFYAEWQARLQAMNTNLLSPAGRIDYVLFLNSLRHDIRALELDAKSFSEQLPYLPFSRSITDLEDARRRFEWADPQVSAGTMNTLLAKVAEAKKQIEASGKAGAGKSDVRVKRTIGNRAIRTLKSLQGTLKRWFEFYDGYDPTFSWWVREPYKNVDQALGNYADVLRESIVGVKADDDTTVIGYPIGREAILSELSYEMIPYSPEELIAIANKEYAWCETEMIKASRELGFGADWHKALESVKMKYVEPGEQPELIRKLAIEAIDFVTKRDMVTVPELARESWRMEMLSPEQQRVSPFFLGGETILVSYPTSTMTHAEKMMTLRGNNPHFSRAVVHHELIPGHHLQGFMNARFRPYRSLFHTPFWTEGWAFYWEMLLWDSGFATTPEDRIGMLFWRMHRSARIIFSLSFHLEKMTPQQCIDFLVKKVGHERANAAAEVRRSFAGSYGPLYQCAYMLGALQFRQLHRDFVESGKMTNLQFHDTILREHNIPIEMVRMILSGNSPAPDFTSSWKFYGGINDK